MSKLNEDINFDLVSNMQKVYLEIYNISNTYLRNYYDDLEKYCTIDIRAVVKKHNIDIIEREMHSSDFFFINQVDGYLDRMKKENNIQYIIYVNENLNETSKRYVIAHEFSHYILEKQKKPIYKPKKGTKTQYCLNVLFSKNIEENICDIMTAFLLMPIDCVLPLMNKFVNSKKNDYPISMNDWLQSLSYCMQISSYHVNLCFQHIRYLVAFIYDKEDKGINDENLIKNIKEYENLFY